MKIWAIADLHLSLGNKEKSMAKLFPSWEGYEKQLQESWDALVDKEDIIILAGDLSWAMRLEDAAPDLAFIGERPGIKVLVKGNHDYWWDTPSKVRKALPDNVHIIQNDVFYKNGVAIGGTRLWNSSEYSFSSVINFQKNLAQSHKEESPEEEEKIFVRELMRLETSLKMMPKEASVRIGVTHFPPIGLSLEPSRASALFEKYGVNHVLFGHLHSLYETIPSLFGKARGVEYTLTSADWLHFTPLCILDRTSVPTP